MGIQTHIHQSQAIYRQGTKGQYWDFRLDAVYGVYFANFYLDGKDNGKLRRDIVLADTETHEVFCDKLRQIYIELPYFIKNEEITVNTNIFEGITSFTLRVPSTMTETTPIGGKEVTTDLTVGTSGGNTRFMFSNTYKILTIYGEGNG